MQLHWDDIQSNAVAFSKRWEHAHNEEAQAQTFIAQLLGVFGVEDPEGIGDYEYKVPMTQNKKGYIDYLWKQKIAIEMKSRDKDLNLAFKQLQEYMKYLPPEEIPDLWLVCDFAMMKLTRRSTNEEWTFRTKDLRRHIHKFANIAGYTTERVNETQVEVNVRAAEKMAKLHDALKGLGYEGHELEVYLVRLLFCLFADDTGIFPQSAFTQYISASKADGSDLSERLSLLFEVLNMPENVRQKRTMLSAELKQFRYINGGLFSDRLGFADFNAKMRQTLLHCCNFDWDKISPAIFGAMFQGVMNPKERREMGAHYTSEENILKVINPLFLNDLWAEFERVKTDPIALEHFHDKIASLKFLDPACGCGNFLIITYRELRRLELEVLKMRHSAGQMRFDITNLLKVGVGQFYGIELEDFPCQIAQVGMWLVDHQMNLRVSDHFGTYYARLPLRDTAHIKQGNALRLNWEELVPPAELSFIMGNPPFVGKKEQSKQQKQDVMDVFRKQKGVGILDYVCCWYKKAADFIQVNPNIRVAFVSTNSISQGEQPSILWRSLENMKIDFAYHTFKWSNEAKGKAAVHCVIVGFSSKDIPTEKRLFIGDCVMITENINAYLVNGPNVLIESHTNPICVAPQMVYGSMPIDNGALILDESEREELLEQEPEMEKYIRRYIGGAELIQNTKRYCIWLQGVAPKEYRNSKFISARIRLCREFREKSNRPQTVALAQFPQLFGEIRQPNSTMLVFPKVSSENRRYIPISFVEPDIIVNGSALIIPNASLYHFGILTSGVHNAWMRAVCGRQEMRYQYSASLVYNTFPWPNCTDEQRKTIEAAAQAVLNARQLYPGHTLDDLYDPDSPAPALLKAHQTLDRYVLKLYSFSPKMTEAEVVAGLMERYLRVTRGMLAG